MYQIFIFTHSILRWVVLFAFILAIVWAYKGKKNDQPFEKKHRISHVVLIATTHLNTMIGLVLYAFLSPVTKGAFQNFGAAMKDSSVRFFAVEHIFGMLLIAVLVTMGTVKSKKAADDQRKHAVALTFFGIAFVILFLSIPWPFYSAGRSLLAFPF